MPLSRGIDVRMSMSRSGLGWLAGAALGLSCSMLTGVAAAEKVAPAGQLGVEGASLGRLAASIGNRLGDLREAIRPASLGPASAKHARRAAIARHIRLDGKPGAAPKKPDDDGGPDTPKSSGTTRYSVAAMGDSLTDPKSHGGRYLAYLRDKCPESRFDSYGVGGNMVNQMRRRFARDVFGEPDPSKPGQRAKKRPNYTHVLVLGGINDICSDESANRSNPKITGDLTKMYQMSRDRGAKVIALTMPPWGGFTRYYNRRRANSTFEVNDWIRQQHLDGNVDGLLDVYPIMSCGEPEFLCEKYGWSDKVHWNKAGHKVVGKALYEAVFADCK